MSPRFCEIEMRGQIHSPAILSHGIRGWLGSIPGLLTVVAEKRIVSVCNQPVWLSYPGLREEARGTQPSCSLRYKERERTNERINEW